MEKRPDFDPERRPYRHRHGWFDDDFLGLDVDRISSGAQVRVAVTVLALVLVGAVAVFALVPWLWWLIFTFGWMIFPAFGLLVRGIAGTSEDRPELSATNSKERELLGALREHGELTPAPGCTRAWWGHLLRPVGARRRGRRTGARGTRQGVMCGVVRGIFASLGR